MAASLKPIKFRYTSPSGDVFAYDAEVTVDQQGIFHVTVAPELEGIASDVRKARAERKADTVSSLTKPIKKLRISSPELRLCQDFVEDLMREHMACEVTVERVILYGTDVRVSYIKQADGRIYANGRECPPGTYEGDQWRGKLSGNTFDDYYRVGLVACVRDRTTYTRGVSVKKAYERVDDGQAPGVQKLNSFVGLRIVEGRLREIPYTEEAATFFHGVMMSLVTLADRIETFFGDKEALQAAIAGGPGMLALGYAPKDEGIAIEAADVG